MTATKKLTKAEACVELARRMGWVAADSELAPGAYKRAMHPVLGVRGDLSHSENETLAKACPVFNDRDAAVELVAWLRRQPTQTCDEFVEALGNIGFDPDQKFTSKAMQLLTCTPEQIALAACAALELEVE